MGIPALVVELGEGRIDTAPPVPRCLADLGLDEHFMTGLAVKASYRLGLQRLSSLSHALKIPRSVATELIEVAEGMALLEPVFQLGEIDPPETWYSLTDKGQNLAANLLGESAYCGPVPVTLADFSRQVERQSIRNETLPRAILRDALANLCLARETQEQIGPAANSAASILLYGPSGNGKSSIAHAIAEAFSDTVYLPHAVVVDDDIITVFDPAIHVEVLEHGQAPRPVEACDQRFVACRRPAVIVGRELTLGQLDLAVNRRGKVYEAPLQMKASGGVLVVDDLGCQSESPLHLVNRILNPALIGFDRLSLADGCDFEIPLDGLTVFATNIPPQDLLNDAVLRRLRHKILVDRPDRDTFVRIFRTAAKDFGLTASTKITNYILDELYGKTPGANLAAFHPSFLIDHVKSISTFEGRRVSFRREFLDRAWRNLFTEDRP